MDKGKTWSWQIFASALLGAIVGGISVVLFFSFVGVSHSSEEIPYQAMEPLPISSSTSTQTRFLLNGTDASSTIFLSQNQDGFFQVQRSGGIDPNHTILEVKAPMSSPNEATVALMRELSDGSAEFLDVYNNGYANQTQYGIRIQKRNGGAYRDFVIDQYDGKTYTPLLFLASSTNIGIGTQMPQEKLDVAGNVKAIGLRLGDQGAEVKQFLSTTMALNLDSLAANSCKDIQADLPGVMEGDVISFALNQAVASQSGLMANAWVSRAGQVSMRICNVSNQALANLPVSEARILVTQILP